MHRRLISAIIVGSVGIAAAGSCGSSDDAGIPPPTGTGTASTPPSTDTDVGNAGTPPQTDARAVEDHLATTIQDIVDASLAPGAINWNCCGVDLPPTGAIVGVRIPGRPDILIAAGTNLDGSALDPTASFSTASLGHSIVDELGRKLVAGGTLDPDATIDAWLPESPNADRITVEMLIDATHGWGNYDDILGDNVIADLTRRWTAGEAVATLKDVAPQAEPGTFVGGSVGTGMLALGYIVEQVTG